MKLVYVMSPYKDVKPTRYKTARGVAEAIALKACEEVKTAGFVPISPVLAFENVYSEERRDEVMEACFVLLNKCDLFYVARSEFTGASEGIKQELAWAKELQINELKISLF